jgi:hypothetical protein
MPLDRIDRREDDEIDVDGFRLYHLLVELIFFIIMGLYEPEGYFGTGAVKWGYPGILGGIRVQGF